MESTTNELNIPEAFLEHRQAFGSSWVNRWIIPNPFVSSLYDLLQSFDVELTDFSFNKDALTVGDTFLNVSVRKLNAAVRIGLNFITFSAANPNWGSASQLLTLFQEIANSVHQIVDARPALQETTLALHVMSEGVDLGHTTASLVNKNILGDSTFYGVSLHRNTGSLLIDKSVRYENAAFIRMQRRFSGDDSFAVIASALYEDEMFALRLLGIVSGAGDSR